MDTLKEYIKNKRPNLSKQSVNTYASILKNLYIRVFGDDNIDINNYNKSTDILNNLKTIPPNKRKTVLSALVIVTDNNDYRNQMLKDIESYTEDQHKQVKNDKQEDSWVDGDEIKTVYDKLAKEAKLLYKKDIILKSQGDQLSMSDLQDIQNYVILSLLGGIYIPPRRSKDYVDFKIHDIDKGHDNYMVKDHFIFNSYKTAKTYGRQMVAIPKELKTIMTKWIKINPTNYLLFDSNKNRLSNVKLNQRLNKLFDHKKVGVNQLRHTYLSDKYQDSIETNNSMANDLTNMGSSMIQEKVYIKKHNKNAKKNSVSDIVDV
jgi:hypothetical protein